MPLLTAAAIRSCVELNMNNGFIVRQMFNNSYSKVYSNLFKFSSNNQNLKLNFLKFLVKNIDGNDWQRFPPQIPQKEKQNFMHNNYIQFPRDRMLWIHSTNGVKQNWVVIYPAILNYMRNMMFDFWPRKFCGK